MKTKILLDTCVWGGTLQELKAEGYDVVWAGEWNDDPGDEEILTIARKENRILITLDKDFGELAVVQEIQHSGIIRLVNFSAKQQGKICQHILRHYHKDLIENTIITVEPNRVRIRHPD